MIELKINHNLNSVFDYVNNLQNNIEMTVSNSVQEAKEILALELPQLFGGGEEDITIDFKYYNGSYTLIVEGINQYQSYYQTGMDFDTLVTYMENRIVDIVQDGLNRNGYGN
jgi:hypothetical protein